MSDADLRARIAQLEAQHAAVAAERDALKARVAELAPTWRPLHRIDFELLVISEANEREHPMGMGWDNVPSQAPLAPSSRTCSQGDWDGMVPC